VVNFLLYIDVSVGSSEFLRKTGKVHHRCFLHLKGTRLRFVSIIDDHRKGLEEEKDKKLHKLYKP
jgi:hypothetical protein